jgi:hypothetical protein
MFLYLKQSNDVKSNAAYQLGEPSPHFLEQQISRFSHLPEHLQHRHSGAGKGVGLAWESIFNVLSNPPSLGHTVSPAG